MMINKRLIHTVAESKKYIAGNVAFQWFALLGNIAMMIAIANLLASLYAGGMDHEGLTGTAAVIAGAVWLYTSGLPDELPVLQAGKANLAGDDLPKTPAPGRGI